MKVGVLVSQDHAFPLDRSFMLDATLVLDQMSIPLSALVDFGADENLLDVNFAAQTCLCYPQYQTPESGPLW